MVGRSDKSMTDVRLAKDVMRTTFVTIGGIRYYPDRRTP